MASLISTMYLHLPPLDQVGFVAVNKGLQGDMVDVIIPKYWYHILP